jgi:hypothetical protein
MTSVPIEIRTQHLPNTSLELCSVHMCSQLTEGSNSFLKSEQFLFESCICWQPRLASRKGTLAAVSGLTVSAEFVT